MAGNHYDPTATISTMAARSQWGVTPRQSIEAECAKRGKHTVAAGCARLIHGDYADTDLIIALGGPGAGKYLDGQEHADDYWLRVWGARGLLWAWDAVAYDAIVLALHDESWRVREMAAKVIARHLLGEALPAVAELRNDPVHRVRVAAERAVASLARAGA